jgi:FixJ family two-component response regulator
MHEDPLHDRGVAVIDDDVGVCESTKFLLEIHGIPTQTFLSGRDFLDRRPDVACLILDYHMPVKDGLEVLADVRSAGVTAPAILVTANRDPSLRQRAAALGIEQVLAKPVSDELVDALKRELEPGRRAIH